MAKYLLDSDCVEVLASSLVGEGGEAEVYSLGADKVVKIYKQPEHPDFSPAQRTLVARRLQELQSKLPSFPKGLPKEVIVPESMVYALPQSEGNGVQIAGFSMHYVDWAQPLRCYMQQDMRRKMAVADEELASIFESMHATISSLHSRNIVVGDLNNLNVLVKGSTAYFIDADSMQFGNYFCSTYCEKYLDPLHFSDNLSLPVMAKAHNAESDWYAFAVLLFEALLFVHPYGGIHRPTGGNRRLSPNERFAKRVTVFSPEVQYPLAARPLSEIPSELRDYFQNVFCLDRREPFPENLIGKICGRLNLLAAPLSLGSSRSKSIFTGPGTILIVNYVGGRLRFLYFSQGKFIRENGKAVLNGNPRIPLYFSIVGGSTLVEGAVSESDESSRAYLLEDGSVRAKIDLEKVSCMQNSSALAANSGAAFYTVGSSLLKFEFGANSSTQSPRFLCEVLERQTRIFVGERFGFGFYRAGGFRRSFVFNIDTGEKRLLPESLIRPGLVDIACYFSDCAVWILSTARDGAVMRNEATLIDMDGKILGCSQAVDGDQSWLGAIVGKFAVSVHGQQREIHHTLLSSNEEQVDQIELIGKELILTRTTACAGLSPADNLILTEQGLYVWNAREIRQVMSKDLQ